MKKMFELQPKEELIKKTKPNKAAFLSSPTFWIAVLLIFIGLTRGLRSFPIIRIILITAGSIGVLLSYIRRVQAYTFYFTNKRIVSNYAFLRKAHREINYQNIKESKIIQGPFGKISGYSDLWIYGYQEGWVVARMRGVSLGDATIILNKAWQKKID
jgi:uncharacterized membrane protein YdbT with pleckstrin-like domain